MIRSMTGFGSSRREQGNFSVASEVKTLNSKYLDIQLKIPRILNEKEMELRNLVAEKLLRGKISLTVEVEIHGDDLASVQFNEALFHRYYRDISKIAERAGDDGKDIFTLAFSQPDVATQRNIEELPEELWKLVLSSLTETLERCDEFRRAEGETLSRHLLDYNERIERQRRHIVDLEKLRGERVRERITRQLGQLQEDERVIDQNRLEQEMIYYLEKLDIAEEIDRLKSHCDYFRKTVEEAEQPGKKLGFICQEIGREINTIGSKANDAEIQQRVVLMKEDLEKLKEQSLNIL